MNDLRAKVEAWDAHREHGCACKNQSADAVRAAIPDEAAIPEDGLWVTQADIAAALIGVGLYGISADPDYDERHVAERVAGEMIRFLTK